MTTIEEKPAEKVRPLDPLRILTITQASQRMGISKITIARLLARDVVDKTPGKNFPEPSRNPLCKGRLEWSEVKIAEWLESR